MNVKQSVRAKLDRQKDCWIILFLLIFAKNNMSHSAFQPNILVESEKMATVSAMEKMLLERLLMRKEIRLSHLEEKLMEQSLNLKKVENKLQNYESLPGLRMLNTIDRAWRVMSGFGGRMVVRGKYIAGDKCTEEVTEDGKDGKDEKESKPDINYSLAIIIILSAVPCWMKISKYIG